MGCFVWLVITVVWYLPGFSLVLLVWLFFFHVIDDSSCLLLIDDLNLTIVFLLNNVWKGWEFIGLNSVYLLYPNSWFDVNSLFVLASCLFLSWGISCSNVAAVCNSCWFRRNTGKSTLEQQCPWWNQSSILGLGGWCKETYLQASSRHTNSYSKTTTYLYILLLWFLSIPVFMCSIVPSHSCHLCMVYCQKTDVNCSNCLTYSFVFGHFDFMLLVG